MEPRKMVNKEGEDTSEGNKTSGKTTRGYDDGSAHITSYVDIPGVGSLRSSYDIDKDGNVSDQHMTEQ